MPDPTTHAQEAADRLRALADELFVEVHALPADLITWQPADGVWSVMDILCHVQEFVPYWTSQVVQIVEHPDRTWGRDHSDADRLAAVANTAERNRQEVERAIRGAVNESAASISHLSDTALAREAPSRNPRWGVKAAGFVVDHLVVQHLEKHIGQIRRNVVQFQQRPS